MLGIRDLVLVITESVREGKNYLTERVGAENIVQTTHERVFTESTEYKLIRLDEFDMHVQGTKIAKAIILDVELTPEQLHFLEGRFAGHQPDIETVEL